MNVKLISINYFSLSGSSML